MALMIPGISCVWATASARIPCKRSDSAVMGLMAAIRDLDNSAVPKIRVKDAPIAELVTAIQSIRPDSIISPTLATSGELSQVASVLE